MQGMSWSITSSYDGRNDYERLSNATETFLSASAGEGELLRHARKQKKPLPHKEAGSRWYNIWKKTF